MWAEAPVAVIDREVQPAVRALLEVLFLIDHCRFSLRAARRAPAAVLSSRAPAVVRARRGGGRSRRYHVPGWGGRGGVGGGGRGGVGRGVARMAAPFAARSRRP